jgi:acyl carrier protein
MTHDEIVTGVKGCLATVLEIPEDTIREADRLIDGLGAESLDMLEVIFQLEQRFGIRISPKNLERRAALALGDRPFTVDGVYTAEALIELHKVMPEIPEADWIEGLHQAGLPKLFRVATLVNLVSVLLEEQREKEANDG